jgi:hypothetical protein
VVLTALAVPEFTKSGALLRLPVPKKEHLTWGQLGSQVRFGQVSTAQSTKYKKCQQHEMAIRGCWIYCSAGLIYSQTVLKCRHTDDVWLGCTDAQGHREAFMMPCQLTVPRRTPPCSTEAIRYGCNRSILQALECCQHERLKYPQIQP